MEKSMQEEFLEWASSEPIESAESFYKRIDALLEETDRILSEEFEQFEPMPENINELFTKAIEAAKACTNSGQ